MHRRGFRDVVNIIEVQHGEGGLFLGSDEVLVKIENYSLTEMGYYCFDDHD